MKVGILAIHVRGYVRHVVLVQQIVRHVILVNILPLAMIISVPAIPDIIKMIPHALLVRDYVPNVVLQQQTALHALLALGTL
jgi:hypothetical protein